MRCKRPRSVKRLRKRLLNPATSRLTSNFSVISGLSLNAVYSYCHKYVPIGRGVCDSKNPPGPLLQRGDVNSLEVP